MEIRYLTVDLDIESKQDLAGLVQDLGEDVMVLHNGPAKTFNHASFELAYDSYSGPDEAISGFCVLIENLSPEARTIWNNCFTRLFDVGFECGSAPNRFWFELRPQTIQRVAAIGASIAMSIYPIPSETT